MHKHTPYHLLHKKLTDQISDSESNLLENLIHSDSDFQEIKDDLTEIWNKSGEYTPSITFNADAALSKFKERINQEKPEISESKDSQVQNEGQPAKVMRMKPTRILLPLAASFLLLIFSVFMYKNYMANNTLVQTEAINYALEDGSEIWLNENSSIQYPESFVNKRNVKLDGEAYFSVSKSQEPFIVEAAGATIEVTATEFNVETTTKGLELEVVEGQVKLIYADSEHVVNAREGLSLVDGQVEEFKLPSENIANWRKEGLSFKADNLNTVITDVESYFAVDINIADSKVDAICNGITSPNVPHTSTVESIFAIISSMGHELLYTKEADGSYLITQFSCTE